MKNNKVKLVISSGKGGVGKSMLASALAMLFSKEKKVIAVDCDVDAPNLAIWLNEVKNWEKTRRVSTSVKAVVDYKKCNGCGLCAQKCHFGAIKMKNGKPVINPFLCEGCGVCEVVCPQKAIHMRPVKNGEIKEKKTKYGFPLVVGQLYPGETGSGKIVSESFLSLTSSYLFILVFANIVSTGGVISFFIVVLVDEPVLILKVNV